MRANAECSVSAADKGTNVRDVFSTAPASSSQLSTFARYALLCVLVAVGIAFFYVIKPFVVPVVLAAVFAGLFNPLYERLLSLTRGRKSLSAMLSCILFCLGLLVPAGAIANLVGYEALRTYDTSRTRIEQFFSTDWQARLGRYPLVEKLNLNNPTVRASAESLAEKAVAAFAIVVNHVSRRTFELVTTILVSFFAMFYFLRDGPLLVRLLKDLSPVPEQYEELLLKRFVSVSRATIKGVLVVALVKGLLSGLTLWLFGIEASLLWGVAIVFLSLLPIVGPWVVMLPAGIVMLANGHVWQGVTLFAITIVFISSIDNILEPILIGRDARMHELLVFFSMLGGIAAFGVAGVVVGPVIAALFRTLLDIYSIEFGGQLRFLHPGSPREG